MSTLNSEIITYGKWVFRLRKGESGFVDPLVLMLHGWTGDENSMGVFAAKITAGTWLLSPRGPYASNEGGYSWLPENGSLHSSINEYRPAIDDLLKIIDLLEIPDPLKHSPLDLIGFSQGAALSYAIACLHPQRVKKVAGLAGFLPRDAEDLLSAQSFAGRKIYITHGTKDDRVPVGMARNAAQLFAQAGAEITYCEEPVGHKLSAKCFRGLADFFTSTSAHNGNQSQKNP